MTQVLLASRSPARLLLLRSAGVQVEVAPADVDEGALKARLLREGRTPVEVASALADAKALFAPQAGAVVVGADQTLELEGALFDKPESLESAAEQLRRLSGRTHLLHSAVAVARGGEVMWRTVDTVTLRMRPLSDAFLHAYLHREGEALLGCVGAYRLEGLGAQLFEEVRGDYFSVLGLPLLPLLGFLRMVGAAPA
jgi:septum formation protein